MATSCSNVRSATRSDCSSSLSVTNYFNQTLEDDTPRAKAVIVISDNTLLHQGMSQQHKLRSCHFFSDKPSPQMYEDIKNKLEQLLCEAEWVAMTTEQRRTYLAEQRYVITTYFTLKNGHGKISNIKTSLHIFYQFNNLLCKDTLFSSVEE